MRYIPFLAVLLAPSTAAAQPKPVPGLKVPPGFVVTQYADHTLANDIYCMTVDPKGRIVVSGRGYIKILVDDDNDGVADRAIDFADSPKDGAMGLLWEKDTLYVTGDGGLRRFFDKDGDGKADGPSELIRKIKTGGEHTAHAIKRGPDGWLYVLCGDGAGIDKSYATLPTSPIKDPIGGCVIRFSPDLKDSEIVAHGFRNAYGMDFNPDGELFTYDSDNERCLSLPWYEPTRFYHVVPGRFYGWQAPQYGRFWRKPPYFFDVMPAAEYLGRGSPTGVACYTHAQFPPAYWDGYFALDWTFGKIHFLRVTLSSSTYEAQKELFLEATGDNGFAPTAAIVEPESGDLFVCSGGRGTRGAVFRIRYLEGFANLDAHKRHRDRLNEFRLLPSLKLRVATKSRGPVGTKKGTLLSGAPDADRTHLDYMLRRIGASDANEIANAVMSAWKTHDRHLRYSAIRLLTQGWPTLSKEVKTAVEEKAKRPSERIVLAAALSRHEPSKSLSLATELLDPDLNAAIVLDAIRTLELVLGDIGEPRHWGTYREGYSLREPHVAGVLLDDDARATLIGKLTSLRGQSKPLDREITRLVPLLGGDISRAYLKATGIEETCHHLFADAGKAEDRKSAALRGLSYFQLLHAAKKDGLSTESNWPLRFKEVFQDWVRQNPAAVDSVITLLDFWDHEGVVLMDADGFPRKSAAEQLLNALARKSTVVIGPSHVRLLAELELKHWEHHLRAWWSEERLRPSLLPILALKQRQEDYDKLLEGLRVSDVSSVEIVIHALNKLPSPKKASATEALNLLHCLRSVPDKKLDLRTAIFTRLALVTGQKDLGTNLDAWRNYLRKTHPALAAKLDNPDGVDVAAWDKRLAKVAWDKGDAERGKKAFTKASCFQCHGGSASVGPDLAGVAGRFSRADLFTAIIQPTKDVPDRYRTTLVESKDGKVYQGLVIYDAIDSLILHTRDGTTARLLGPDIATRRMIDLSPMPSGLLDGLNDEEIADLYAFMRAKK